jgi:hypothetical protein
MLFIFLWLTIWRIGVAFLLVLVVKSWMDGSIASSAQAWFNASDTVVLAGAAAAGFRAYWGGSCYSAGGTEAGNGTALATCTLDNPGSAKIITVTFTRNLYLPLIRGQ